MFITLKIYSIQFIIIKMIVSICVIAYVMSTILCIEHKPDLASHLHFLMPQSCYSMMATYNSLTIITHLGWNCKECENLFNITLNLLFGENGRKKRRFNWYIYFEGDLVCVSKRSSNMWPLERESTWEEHCRPKDNKVYTIKKRWKYTCSSFTDFRNVTKPRSLLWLIWTFIW